MNTGHYQHRSIMVEEVIESLAPRSPGLYVDATAGGGGHSAALLDASEPEGKVVAVDRDPRAVAVTRERLARYGARAVVVHGEFSELRRILREQGAERVDGLLADLGVSSPQLDEPDRGFSFGQTGPLDMRMDTSSGETLAELLDRVGESELADILYHYGEERRSRAIARSIVAARDAGELATTLDLRRAIVRASGKRRGRIDPATRSFQGLRIALNRELEQLEALLEALPDLLADDAVAAIISFHSLEDRLVKRCFRDDDRFAPLTKRPRVAGEVELGQNPRARSAKLRAARRVPRAAEHPVEVA